LCVCELTEALGLSQPKISRHLATLKALNPEGANETAWGNSMDLPPALTL
ncbi:MAG TPA: ArsR family transcriptional regulator, partial [Candidatus Latescibacteria bacterium]|nr:ArsR family transcriptional regulator [Candidatus Latescibacterota bacterium]